MSHASTLRTKVTEGGRIVIPAAVRKELGLAPGDEVLLQVEGGELRVFSQAHALRRLQERLREVAPRDASLVDELIAERRQETLRE